jgi:hypothetical protein
LTLPCSALENASPDPDTAPVGQRSAYRGFLALRTGAAPAGEITVEARRARCGALRSHSMWLLAVLLDKSSAWLRTARASHCRMTGRKRGAEHTEFSGLPDSIVRGS